MKQANKTFFTAKEARSFFSKPAKKRISREKIFIEFELRQHGFEFMDKVTISEFDKKAYTTEYKFCPDRKFRFDWAIPALKVAFEYEGIFGGKSRHTSVIGYTNDTEKYNLAQKLGWRVFRYTAKNYREITGVLKAISVNKICPDCGCLLLVKGLDYDCACCGYSE